MTVLTAALFLVQGSPLRAATFCVHNTTELRDALLTAQDNIEDNLVLVARGDYPTGDTPFRYFNLSFRYLGLVGGYNATCTIASRDASRTVLDGGNQSQILSVNNGGGTAISNLTFQNGHESGEGGAVTINRNSDQGGELTFSYNVVRNNSASENGGGMYIGVGNFPAPGRVVYLHNNLVYGNTAETEGGAAVIFGISNSVYLINNSFVFNSIVAGSSGYGGVVFSGGSLKMANNIFWGNDVGDLHLSGQSGVVAVNNDIGVVNIVLPPGTDNLDTAPLFVDTGGNDFRLRRSSPLINAGTATPPATLPAYDIVGHPRNSLGGVDMGAYERADAVFSDGFQ